MHPRLFIIGLLQSLIGPKCVVVLRRLKNCGSRFVLSSLMGFCHYVFEKSLIRSVFIVLVERRGSHFLGYISIFSGDREEFKILLFTVLM